MINLKWKRSATARDMTEVLRFCRARRWIVWTTRGLWMIDTKAPPADALGWMPVPAMPAGEGEPCWKV